jgi:hypothetical protein
MQFPWITTPKIVRALAEHSVLPHPDFLYDVVVGSELKGGPNGHHGVVADPTQKSNYRQWFDLDDDIAARQSHLRIWLDEKGVWKKASDTHESTIRLPVAETVDFFEDHWEQVNPNGRFSGQVEAYSVNEGLLTWIIHEVSSQERKDALKSR